MKRALWLLIAAALLVWGGTLLDFGAVRAPDVEGAVDPSSIETPTSVPDDDRPQVATPTQEPARVPSSVEAKSASPTGAEKPPSGQSQFGELTSPVERVGSALVNATKQVAEEIATGELGEGVLSPEFNDSERLYVTEARDGPWAREQEQRVRDLFKGGPLKAQLVLVHCQETICRIVLEGKSEGAFKDLLGVPGLQKATAIGPQTPYSLRTGQLSVYFRRSDEPLDGP